MPAPCTCKVTKTNNSEYLRQAQYILLKVLCHPLSYPFVHGLSSTMEARPWCQQAKGTNALRIPAVTEESTYTLHAHSGFGTPKVWHHQPTKNESILNQGKQAEPEMGVQAPPLRPGDADLSSMGTLVLVFTDRYFSLQPPHSR